MLTETTADTVVIGEKVLLHTSRYRLRLYVTLDEQTGFAEEELFMNQPPNGGECAISKNRDLFTNLLTYPLVFVLYDS